MNKLTRLAGFSSDAGELGVDAGGKLVTKVDVVDGCDRELDTSVMVDVRLCVVAARTAPAHVSASQGTRSGAIRYISEASLQGTKASGTNRASWLYIREAIA